MDGFCGIVHKDPEHKIIHVPLEESIISVAIVDISARVSVTQTYRNELDTPTPRSKYVFPVPARAAVCAFSMTTQDRPTIIYGEVKEKTQAGEEYEAGIRDGRLTALVDWVTDDVFTISLGSIPAKRSVTTRIMFVMDLINDDLSDKVRLQLPLSLGQRYGPIPPGLIDAITTTSRTRVKITAEIQTSGTILNVTSPSHNINVEPYETHVGRPSNRRRIAKFRSKVFLDRDFVLIIQADGLDAPRCFMERDSRGDTVGLQLSLVPKFGLPPIPQQEYIFLVDRSGSMDSDAQTGASRIEVAKRSLAMLVRCLPSQNTQFNIFSFGNVCIRFRQNSVTYNESNLQEAVGHIDQMDSKLGGTDLCRALEIVLRARLGTMSTAIFVLTDGEISGSEEVHAKAIVTAAVSSSRPDAPLRLFVLGIGLQTSTAVCEGLARIGNGECLMAMNTENILGKCTNLLRAGRTSTIKNVSIDWGFIPNPYPETKVDLNTPVPIQQSPAVIGDMYPHSRFVVFAILATSRRPDKVVIRGTTDDGTPVTFEVEVESVKLGQDSSHLPFVHVLAARRLIRDLEEGRSEENGPEAVRKAAIIRLGTWYQLACSHTSFVAVDYEDVRTTRTHYSTSTSAIINTMQNLWMSVSNFNFNFNPRHLLRSFSQSLPKTNLLGGWQNTSQTQASLHSESSSSSLGINDELDHESSCSSTDTFSTLSTLESYLSLDSGSEGPSRRQRARSRHRRRQAHSAEHQRSPSPQVYPTPEAVERQRARNSATSPQSSTTPRQQISPKVDELVGLMSSDGSFPLNVALGNIIDLRTLDEARALHANERLCAVALAFAFLEKSLGNQLELLQVVKDKGMEFVRNHASSSEFSHILARAREILQN